MKVELLTKRGIKNTFDTLEINAEMVYKRTEKPYYEVWTLDKKDLKLLEEEGCGSGGAWFGIASGCNLGTPFEFLDIRGQFVIGWSTKDGTTKYDSLIDYLKDGLEVVESDDVCATVTALAKANGMTLEKLFKLCQG